MIEEDCKNNVCELTLVVMEGAFCPGSTRAVGRLWREHVRNYNSQTLGPASLTSLHCSLDHTGPPWELT